GGYPVPPRASRTRTYVRPDWRRLVNAANNKTTRGPVIATLHTPNTSIVLPSLLQSGRTYVLVLEALGGTGYPPLDITKPLQGRVDTVSVMVSSGILTAP